VKIFHIKSWAEEPKGKPIFNADIGRHIQVHQVKNADGTVKEIHLKTLNYSIHITKDEFTWLAMAFSQMGPGSPLALIPQEVVGKSKGSLRERWRQLRRRIPKT
jgi:hypothetical protein